VTSNSVLLYIGKPCDTVRFIYSDWHLKMLLWTVLWISKPEKAQVSLKWKAPQTRSAADGCHDIRHLWMIIALFSPERSNNRASLQSHYCKKITRLSLTNRATR